MGNNVNVPVIRLGQANHGIFYAPQYVCLSLKLFQRAGVVVDLSTSGGGPNVADALLNERIDIGRAGPIRTLIMAERGHRLVNIAEINSRAGFYLLGRREDSDFSWLKLIGATIIAPKEPAIPWLCTEYVLRKNGIEPSAVRIIRDIPFEGMTAAFRSGVGDYVIQFQPEAELLMEEKTANFSINAGEAVGPIPFSSYVVTNDFLTKNPAIITKFLIAFCWALKWVNSHTAAETAEVIASYFPSVSRNVLVRSVRGYLEAKTWPLDPMLRKVGFEHLREIVIKGNVISQRHTYEEYVNTELASAATVEATRLKSN